MTPEQAVARYEEMVNNFGVETVLKEDVLERGTGRSTRQMFRAKLMAETGDQDVFLVYSNALLARSMARQFAHLFKIDRIYQPGNKIVFGSNRLLFCYFEQRVAGLRGKVIFDHDTMREARQRLGLVKLESKFLEWRNVRL